MEQYEYRDQYKSIIKYYLSFINIYKKYHPFISMIFLIFNHYA